MSENDEAAITAIAGAIRRYFTANPGAADSSDGIQRWWLPSQLLEEPLPLVEEALERLVREGVMARMAQEDGRVIYGPAARAD
jgi:hypothetical protein